MGGDETWWLNNTGRVGQRYYDRRELGKLGQGGKYWEWQISMARRMMGKGKMGDGEGTKQTRNVSMIR